MTAEIEPGGWKTVKTGEWCEDPEVPIEHELEATVSKQVFVFNGDHPGIEAGTRVRLLTRGEDIDRHAEALRHYQVADPVTGRFLGMIPFGALTPVKDE
jgi:hypothetical protein